MFSACTSLLGVLRTMSEISNTFRGLGRFKFEESVLRIPGMREVRTTWNSAALGLATCTAGIYNKKQIK